MKCDMCGYVFEQEEGKLLKEGKYVNEQMGIVSIYTPMTSPSEHNFVHLCKSCLLKVIGFIGVERGSL